MASPAAWEIGLRAQVNALGVGWGVRENRGNMYLRLTSSSGSQQQVPVGFAWNKSHAANAYLRIRNIVHLYDLGSDLKTAAKKAKAESITAELDWQVVAEKFRAQKINHGNTIKPATWLKEYEPVISQAIELLQSRRPPSSPAELIERCIKRWEPGSRTREARARNLAAFLRFAVQRHHAPSQWQPMTDLRDHIGRPLPADQRKPQPRRGKGSPLEDRQIINLIESMANDEPGLRWADDNRGMKWANALKLVAAYGLRPVELRHLSVRRDISSGDMALFCSYSKRSGGGCTEPRWLFPLPPAGSDWKLLELMEAGLLELPSLRSDNQAASAMGLYLRRNTPAWASLKELMRSQGQTLCLYSLRHSYSLRGHRQGIPSGAMADAMGHSLESHHREYAWSSPATTRAAFAKVAADAETYKIVAQ